MGASQSTESIEKVEVSSQEVVETPVETNIEPYQHEDASMDWFWPVI